MNPFRPLLLALALGTLPLMTAQAAEPVRVLTALPITHTLADLLLKGSDVQLERAAPANLPASRQPSYFAGRGAAALHKVAADADAVIAVRSLWADDPLYPLARRSNIRIVEIDAARPVDGALPGIALQADTASGAALASHPWLVVNNFGRMADVVAADLIRLVPAARPQVENNLAALKKRLLDLNAKSEAALARADNLSVVSLSDRLGYLISGLNLDLLSSDTRADDQWTEAAAEEFAEQLKADDVAAVLHHRQPPAALRDAIAASGIPLVVLETEGADSLAELEGNIARVDEALAGK